MSLRSFSSFQSFFENKKILVIGGTGFLGSSLIDCLQQLGVKTSSLSLHKKHPSAENILLDWEDEVAMTEAFANKTFDMVFNFGGYLNPSRDPKDEMKIINNHFKGTRNLFQHLNWSTIQLFFHLGSAEEYGEAVSPQSEQSLCSPTSPYGLAKVMATQYCQMREVNRHLPVVIGRSNIVYGSKMQSGLCHYVLSRVLADKNIELSPGLQKRDFIHIDDFLHGVLTIACGFMRERVNQGEILNIASGQAKTVKEFVELCCMLAQGGKPSFGALSYREGESMAVFANVEKMKSKLGWSAEISLLEGLRDTIRHLRGEK